MPEFQLGDTIPDQEALIRALRGMTPDQRSQGVPGYAGAKYMGGRIIPGITNYLTQDQPPPSMQAVPSGKVPTGDNPNLPGALGEAGLLGLGGGASGLIGHALTGAAAGLMSPAEAAEKKSPPNKSAALPPQGGPQPVAGPPPEPEVPGGSRPHYTQEDVKRLGEIQAEIKRLTANPGDSPKTTRQTLQGLQQEESDIRNNMRTLQTAYDKQGQPLAMRDPAMVDALRKGAFELAAAHGATRGLLKKNPVGTLGLGALEAVSGAFAPTFMDLFAPPDTQAYKQSHHNLTDPEYYKNVVAPDVLFGGGALSGMGHGIGSTVRAAGEQGVRGAKNFVDWRRSLKEGPPEPPNAPGGGGGLGAVPAGPSPYEPPPNWGTIDPSSPAAISQILKQGAGGKWHRPSGAFTKTGKPAND